MPIEFACEECKRVLRVPDGSSGKRSRCPSCQHEQEIPWVATSVKPASNKLNIPCPQCKHQVVCTPDLLGKLGKCNNCEHLFIISEQPAASKSAAGALVFHCPSCQKIFQGREEMRGRKGRCDECQAVFPIELVPAAQKQKTLEVVKTAPQPRVDEEELQIVEAPAPKRSHAAPAPSPASTRAPTPAPKPAPRVAQPKPAPAAGPICFDCRHCGGVMEVPGSTAGLDTACPYCQQVQTIPAASTASALAKAAPAAAGYGQAAATQAYDPLGGLDFSAPNQFGANQFGPISFGSLAATRMLLPHKPGLHRPQVFQVVAPVASRSATS